VFELFGEGAHTVELTSAWGKTILFGGHRFGDIYQLLLLEVEDEVDNLSVAAMYFGPRALREAIAGKSIQENYQQIHCFHKFS
jgi:hypothetical protein